MSFSINRFVVVGGFMHEYWPRDWWFLKSAKTMAALGHFLKKVHAAAISETKSEGKKNYEQELVPPFTG